MNSRNAHLIVDAYRADDFPIVSTLEYDPLVRNKSCLSINLDQVQARAAAPALALQTRRSMVPRKHTCESQPPRHGPSRFGGHRSHTHKERLVLHRQVASVPVVGRLHRPSYRWSAYAMQGSRPSSKRKSRSVPGTRFCELARGSRPGGDCLALLRYWCRSRIQLRYRHHSREYCSSWGGSPEQSLHRSTQYSSNALCSVFCPCGSILAQNAALVGNAIWSHNRHTWTYQIETIESLPKATSFCAHAIALTGLPVVQLGQVPLAATKRKSRRRRTCLVLGDK
jgi:hypothetical protein